MFAIWGRSSRVLFSVESALVRINPRYGENNVIVACIAAPSLREYVLTVVAPFAPATQLKC